MIREILVWPNHRLTKRCEEVTEFNTHLTQLVIDLHQTANRFNTREDLPDAVGLAAPQIGVMKRVFVYKMGENESCMINPVILEREDEQKEAEGCLSFPGVFVKVPRTDKILVEFQDVDGNKNQLRTDGFLSRVIQHELDHLNGTTYLKALSGLKRDLVTRKMKKAKRNADRQKAQMDKFSRTIGA